MDQLDAILDATTAATEVASQGDLMDQFVTGLTEDVPPAAAEPDADEPPPAAEPTTEEPPKPEEQPPAADDDAVPEVPKNRKDWDTLRGSRDRWKGEAEEVKTILQTKDQTIQTLQQQLEELRNQAARLPELEDKLKDFDTYEKELAVTRLEATREYRETIAAPLETIGKQAEQLAQSNETDYGVIQDVMLEADPTKQRQAFREATSGWDELDKAELWSMMKDARTLLDKQDLMRQNASAAAREQQEKAQQREQLEREEAKRAFVGSLKDVTKSLREKTPFVPTVEGETEDDRYRLLEQKVAEVDFDAQSPRGKAFAAAAAILHPQMVKTISKLQSEIDTLRERVKKENSNRASLAPSDQSNAPSNEPQDFLTAMGVPTNPTLSQSLM